MREYRGLRTRGVFTAKARRRPRGVGVTGGGTGAWPGLGRESRALAVADSSDTRMQGGHAAPLDRSHEPIGIEDKMAMYVGPGEEGRGGVRA